MAEFSINIKGIALNKNELSDSDAKLLKMAEEAAENAYAPYSQFNVGSALRLANVSICDRYKPRECCLPIWPVCRACCTLFIVHKLSE